MKEKDNDSNLPKKELKERKNKKNKKNKLEEKELNENEKEFNENEISEKDNDNMNLNLIKINLKRRNSISIKSSNYILDIYTFEEAGEYDFRALCKIFFIYLLTKQAFFHAFLFRSPLSLFPLRFCLLLFIISSDLALNAVFYFDDKISEKYRLAKSIFVFAFNNNITVILLSTFIGFILLTLFTKLSNATNDIREVFRNEEEKLKNDKKYKVSDKRKDEINEEIEKILKNYKIKLFIFIAIEIILMMFFWYYVTAFCHVYVKTQMSWLFDSFLSMFSRLIIDALLSLVFAKLYRIGVESHVTCLYKASLFFYSFG